MTTMKHYSYYIFAALMCCALVCCKEKSNEVIITGQLEGVEDGAILSLWTFDGYQGYLLQSDTVVNGAFRFSFADTLNQVKQLLMVSNGEGFSPARLDVWVLPGVKVKITGKDKLIHSWDVKSSVPEQKEWNKYKACTEQYDRVRQSVAIEVHSYFVEVNQFPEKREELMPKIDSLCAVSDSLFSLVMETEIDFMAQNKTYSPVWMEKYRSYANSHRAIAFSNGQRNISDEYLAKLKGLYEGMSDELKNSEKGQSIYANLFPLPVVKEGDDMVDADFWNLDGELCHLSDYKGKYILLDFWFSGCAPCIAAMPKVKEISEKYQDKLVVVAINLDAKEKWESVSKEHDIAGVNLNDFKSFDGIALRYGVAAVPTYVIISPEGKVLSIMVGAQFLRAKIEELVK